MKGLLERVWRGVGKPRPVDYEESKRIARGGDIAARRHLAANPTARPELLYFLADDPAAEVRREIANNPTTPAQADLILASDRDDQVRVDLAHKISRLLPGADQVDQSTVGRVVIQVLAVLARDQLVAVRQAMAEAVKDLSNVPAAIVRDLAGDDVIEVAGPVLRFSPLLSDDDLLSIIRANPIPGALSAIARRSQVAEPVADSIVERADDAAVADLLANPKAQIREETLDGILDRAPNVESWHQPLTRRPTLSRRAITRLAEFVAESMLETLKGRDDLDSETTEQLASAVRLRLSKRAAGDDAPVESPEDEARRLHQAGRLDEQTLTERMAAGQRDFVAAGLGLRAEFDRRSVERILAAQSAKAAVALCWKANVSMRFATQLQSRLARVPPKKIIGGDGAYPMREDEMTWQLEFFGP